MNNSLAVFLLNDTARAVMVNYDPDKSREKQTTYMFKTFDPTIKVGDFVVVPTSTRHGMTVCKVVEVDVDVDFDTPPTVQFKWIVGKVDRAPYDKMLADEAHAITVINSAEKTKKRNELRNALLADNADLIKALPIAAPPELPPA